MEHTSSSQSSFTPSPEEPMGTPQKHGALFEILQFSVIALIIVLPIRFFVAQPFLVSGESMETTFSTDQYLIVDQLTYHLEEPKRGDVIIFRYPKEPSKFFIKRIIGMPGDTVTIEGSTVTITNPTYPNGKTLTEPYIHSMKPGVTITETLGTEEYFVMGDNRDKSSDSRSWGVLQRDKIVGRAFLRLFPVSKIGAFPGKYDIEEKMKLQE